MKNATPIKEQKPLGTPTPRGRTKTSCWRKKCCDRLLALCCLAPALLSLYRSLHIEVSLSVTPRLDDVSYQNLNELKKQLGQKNTIQNNNRINGTQNTKHKFESHKLPSKSSDDAGSTTSHQKLLKQLASNGNAGSSILQRAIQECSAAYEEFGAYPSVMKQLIALRQLDWRTKFDPIGRMAGEKLGDKVYAAKVGVRAPKLYFCGQAKDLPRNVSSLGDNFVLKPINGWSGKGVKVVVNGRNKLAKNQRDKKLLYKALIDEYGKDTFVVAEELVESARPDLKGMVPPDYKFFVSEGQIEYFTFVDRNKDNGADLLDPVSKKRVRKCAHFSYIDNIDGGWKPIPGAGLCSYDLCQIDDYGLGSDSKNAEMIAAVQNLTAFLRHNYMRIDMFDSKDGPMLGEFTPFSCNGHEAHDYPLTGCIQSYMFIRHAVESRVSDDARLTLSKFLKRGPRLNHLLRKNNNLLDKKKSTAYQALVNRILSWIPANYTTSLNNSAGTGAERHPTPSSLVGVANIWSNLTMQEKCDQTIRAQRDYWDDLNHKTLQKQLIKVNRKEQ